MRHGATYIQSHLLDVFILSVIKHVGLKTRNSGIETIMIGRETLGRPAELRNWRWIGK